MTCTQCNTQVSASLIICPNCSADLTSMPGSEHLQEPSLTTTQYQDSEPATRSCEPNSPMPSYETTAPLSPMPRPQQAAQPSKEESAEEAASTNKEKSKLRNTIRSIALLLPFAAIAVVLISSFILFRNDTGSLIFLVIISALTLIPFFIIFNAESSQLGRRVIFTILAVGIVIGLISGGSFAIDAADYEPERYPQGISLIIAGILYGIGCLAALANPKPISQ